MPSRFVQPESVRLNLSEGDWILVKKRLTTGEQRASYGRMYHTVEGVRQFDPQQHRMALVTAYLLDWNFTDSDGKPVVIRNQQLPVVESILDSLDYDSFDEIYAAIDAHESAIRAEREALKKTLNGEPKSAVISPSPDAVDGDTKMSSDSIQTSTPSSLIN